MYAILAPVGVMNTATNAGSSYYTAILNEKMKKGPCVAMTLYGIIVLERVKSWRRRSWAGNVAENLGGGVRMGTVEKGVK